MELGLLTAIQELPGRQRAVLILRDVLGWSSPEVADLLETSVAAVNSALQRARATIDESLPTAGPAPADEDERELLHRYVRVFANDDVDGLVAILRGMRSCACPAAGGYRGGRDRRVLPSVAPGGTYANFHHTPTWANGRPAVAIYMRSRRRAHPARRLRALVIEGGQIIGIEAFVDPALPARFEGSAL